MHKGYFYFSNDVLQIHKEEVFSGQRGLHHRYLMSKRDTFVRSTIDCVSVPRACFWKRTV